MTIIRIIFELTALFAYLGVLSVATLTVASHEARRPKRVPVEAQGRVSRHGRTPR